MRRVFRAGRFVQISSVTCGMIGCRRASRRSSATSAVAAGGRVLLVEPRLDRLGVPVAEVVEREPVDGVHGAGELERLDRVPDLARGGVDARQDPALLHLGGLQGGLDSFGVPEDEPAHVPELVRELAPLLDRAVGEAHVLRRGHLQEPVAHRVRPVVGDHVERVDAGAEALRHAAPVGGEHGRVDDHVVERDLAHELEAHEEHAVLPEADDLARGRLEMPGIERLEVRRGVGPAERRERPERRREPGVEHVVGAHELGRAAVAARIRIGVAHGQVAVRALPDREPVTPPELPRDAPVGGVLERVVGVAVLRLGMEADGAGLERAHGGLLQLVHGAPPLERDQRLDAAFAALAEGDGVPVGLALLEEAALLAPGDDLLRRLLLGEAGELGDVVVHAAVGADAHRLGQRVRAADLEVLLVVAGRHLERARCRTRGRRARPRSRARAARRTGRSPPCRRRPCSAGRRDGRPPRRRQGMVAGRAVAIAT